MDEEPFGEHLSTAYARQTQDLHSETIICGWLSWINQSAETGFFSPPCDRLVKINSPVFSSLATKYETTTKHTKGIRVRTFVTNFRSS